MYEDYAKIRDSKGLRDSDVSKGTGISSSVFSDWKKKRYELKYDKLKKIADFFGVSTDQLAGEYKSYESKYKITVHKKYYDDKKVEELAQQMFDDPQLRALHHIKKNTQYEKFLAYYQMIEKLYKAEHPNDNYDFDNGKQADGSEDV